MSLIEGDGCPCSLSAVSCEPANDGTDDSAAVDTEVVVVLVGAASSPLTSDDDEADPHADKTNARATIAAA